MKIIDTDNFGGDYPDEQFVAEGIPTIEMANCMCNALNERYGGPKAPRFYRVVQDDYVLQPGFEP